MPGMAGAITIYGSFKLVQTGDVLFENNVTDKIRPEPFIAAIMKGKGLVGNGFCLRMAGISFSEATWLKEVRGSLPAPWGFCLCSRKRLYGHISAQWEFNHGFPRPGRTRNCIL